MDYETLTIGFARRATAYKRMDLIFHDSATNNSHGSINIGKMQFVFAAKPILTIPQEKN